MQTSNLNKTQPFGNKFFLIIIIIVLLKYLSSFIKTKQKERKKNKARHAITCTEQKEEEGKLLSLPLQFLSDPQTNQDKKNHIIKSTQ